LLRDSTLFLLLILLIVFPATFNSVLVSAGFQEGSIAGFKWSKEYIDSNDKLETAQVTITGLQEQNNQLVDALDAANSKLQDSDLKSKIENLAIENQVLKDKTEMVQLTVSNTLDNNAPFIQKALAAVDDDGIRTTSDFTVGVQTLGVPDEERVSINKRLSSNGYKIDDLTWSYPADERPSWFAYDSTVFYYSATSYAQAQQLSKLMRSITGQAFVVKRGAGLGVDPDKKDTTIFVHYIK